MSKRDVALYIENILDASKAIQEFTASMSFEAFISDRKTYSATLREYTVFSRHTFPRV